MSPLALLFLVELQTSSRFKGVTRKTKNGKWAARLYVSKVGIRLIRPLRMCCVKWTGQQYIE